MKAEARKRAIATATRVVINDDGNGNSSKSNGNIDKGDWQATTRVMEVAQLLQATIRAMAAAIMW